MNETIVVRLPAARRRNPIVVAITAFLGMLGRAPALWRDRREVRQLAELDDHMLKDIGLVRGQVHGALAAPLHRSPSRMLVVITGRD